VKTLLKISLVLVIGLSASAVLAFHDGGVAECAGCHTMHNSQDGAVVDSNNPGGNEYLLNNGNATDTCLRCHAGYGQFAGGSGYGPGGDFYWVTRTFSWSAHGRTYYSQGDSHGHNVISPAYGIAQDATLTEAPGGDFLSQYLRCTSCHDPHGNQNFRLLYGTEEGPKYNGGRYAFASPAPEAKGNSRRTINSDGEETNAMHTVYKNGMSDWCANCHTDFHSDNTTNFVHPTGEELGSTVAANYNAYVSSDQITGGSAATAYLGLVPFEDVDVDLETVDTENYTAGPTGVDQVMCLSCHRAHASPFGDAARWDMAETFLVDSHPNTGDIDFVQSDVDNAYYNYTFVTNQRSLCNKCHVKDAGDAPYGSH
jgi:predicted CXXCH cytochrome family protein